jgi:hypothetical protein
MTAKSGEVQACVFDAYGTLFESLPRRAVVAICLVTTISTS